MAFHLPMPLTCEEGNEKDDPQLAAWQVKDDRQWEKSSRVFLDQCSCWVNFLVLGLLSFPIFFFSSL